MAWALVDNDSWGVTARMQVEFKRPVPIGRRIRGEGRVVEAKRRIVRAEGVLLDAADGTVLATAEGTFVAAPDDAQAGAQGALRLPPRARAHRDARHRGSRQRRDRVAPTVGAAR